MVSKRKFFKTVVSIEILSADQPWDGDIDALAYDITEGDCSASMDSDGGIELTVWELISACKKQDSNSDYLFQIDPDTGEDIDY